MSATIALIDPIWGGHHGTYLGMAARCILDRGMRIAVFSPQPHALDQMLRMHPAYLSSRSACRPLPPLRPVASPASRLHPAKAALSRWLQARQAIRAMGEERVEMAFFSWLDSYVDRFVPGWLVDVLFPYSWSGIYFHPRHLRGARSRWRLLRRFASPDSTLNARRCLAVGVLDHYAGQLLVPRLSPKPVIEFPDVADGTPPQDVDGLAAGVRSRAGGRFVVGVLGSLEKRKGILTALRAAKLLEGKDILFVFAGVLQSSTFSPSELADLELTARQSSNCHFVLGEIPGEGAFNALVSECDVLFAAYEAFPHSSNLLSKAALFQKPVIVSRGSYMQEVTERYNLGIAVPEASPAACADAIGALMREGEAGWHVPRQYRLFSERNSPSEFCRAVNAALCAVDHGS